MTSKIKVDNIENQCGGAVVTKCGATTTISGSVVKADDIQAADGGNLINQCGTTITLGASGDTISLASGASQTGFGRTGTVDWQTGDIKTATFTAANGEGYFANTSGGAFVMNLPAGSAGAIVSVVDYSTSFGTNALTVTPNGSEKLAGNTGSAFLTTDGQSVTLVYVDATKGWITVNDSEENISLNPFITASISGTGNTISACGSCDVAKFTGPGTFTVSSAATCAVNNVVSYMIVAGGGGSGNYAGAGGGAGGFREFKSPVTPYVASPLEGSTPITVSAQDYPITVGGGGAGSTTPGDPGGPGTRGTPSTALGLTSTGGGAGATQPSPSPQGPGGSGGGGSEGQSGASGNTPPVSPPQGNNGGNGSGPGPQNDYYEEAGGGGGGTAVGSNGTHDGPPTANGGAGATTSISGSPTAYAGGGGGGKGSESAGGGIPQGGTGGGGNGSYQTTDGEAGTVNTGGGGGGIGAGPGAPYNFPGKAGGSGIVVIRYKAR